MSKQIDLEAISKLLSSLDFQNTDVIRDIMAKYGGLINVIGDGAISTFIQYETRATTLRKIYKIVKDTDFHWAVGHLMSNPKTPRDVLNDVLEHGDEIYRSQAARFGGLSDAQIRQYANDKNLDIVRVISENTGIDDDIATTIMKRIRNEEVPIKGFSWGLFGEIIDKLLDNPAVSKKKKSAIKRQKKVRAYLQFKKEREEWKEKNARMLEKFLKDEVTLDELKSEIINTPKPKKKQKRTKQKDKKKKKGKK